MAENEKLDNLLQMALDLTQMQRGQDSNLNAGFDSENRTWELIVKYHGDLSALEGSAIKVEPLLFGYAIVTIPEGLIPAFAALDEVEYIEKPKLLFPQTQEGIRASCIWPVQRQSPYLTGRGMLISVIDSGITYTDEAFLNRDGTTRIVAIYDQALSKEFTREEINDALLSGERLPTVDVSGHGTSVAAIAAGSVGAYQGVAYEADILAVKLDSANQYSYPMTTSLLRAFQYVLEKAQTLNRPTAINLSFGNTYGAHDGRSLVERFIDSAAEYGRNVICVGSGNEGTAYGHAAGRIFNRNEVQGVPFFIGSYETGLSVQLWKNYEDIYRIRLISPGGQTFTLPERLQNAPTFRYQLEDTVIYAYAGGPKPYSTKQEIYFQFEPVGRYINEGVWQIELVPESIVTGEYDLYLPSYSVKSEYTRFLTPSVNRTYTIPSTAQRVITVGAYDTVYDAYADFSGRGYVATQREDGESYVLGAKPDIVAPGVGIVTTNGREKVVLNGTSFATPFVTGSAALLMEWGIGMGNDPYLYGEKVKAYLIRGARRLPGFTEYPNAQVGYGALCVSGSLPE